MSGESIVGSEVREDEFLHVARSVCGGHGGQRGRAGAVAAPSAARAPSLRGRASAETEAIHRYHER